MELNEAVQNFKEFNKKMHAYYHAMGVLYYDFETAAPKNAAPVTTPVGRPDEVTAARKPVVKYEKPAE